MAAKECSLMGVYYPWFLKSNIVLWQVFPCNLRASTLPDPSKPGEVIGVSELERRGEYISLLETKTGRVSMDTVCLTKECLDNDPNRRPSASECLGRLENITDTIQNNFELSFGKVDVMRIKLEKEKMAKDREINLLIRQKVSWLIFCYVDQCSSFVNISNNQLIHLYRSGLLDCPDILSYRNLSTYLLIRLTTYVVVVFRWVY